MWNPDDSKLATLFSGIVTMEKNPLDDETDVEISFVKEFKSFNVP